ncbi:MAG: type II toxin-antitoxin system RelE/ParE family toxin [Methylococcales bacterium]
MIQEVRLRPEAERDLTDAAAWYEEQRQGLGHEFLDEVMTMLSSVAETPLLYAVVDRATRRAVINRFPFGIYYRVENPRKAEPVYRVPPFGTNLIAVCLLSD